MCFLILYDGNSFHTFLWLENYNYKITNNNNWLLLPKCDTPAKITCDRWGVCETSGSCDSHFRSHVSCCCNSWICPCIWVSASSTWKEESPHFHIEKNLPKMLLQHKDKRWSTFWQRRSFQPHLFHKHVEHLLTFCIFSAFLHFSLFCLCAHFALGTKQTHREFRGTGSLLWLLFQLYLWGLT